MQSIKFKNMLAAILMLAVVPLAWAGKGYGGPPGDSSMQGFDTSYAVEYSQSCLGGGCHETDQQLVDEYSASFMTHVMVKCNACHGTHTAETVGLEKPNLTGHYPGIGASGYTVGRDRCLTCHNNQHPRGRKAQDECKSCHQPHVFD